MSRLAQINMLIITCVVVIMEGCVIDYGNRIKFLEGRLDSIQEQFTDIQNQQAIEQSEQRRVDQEANKP